MVLVVTGAALHSDGTARRVRAARLRFALNRIIPGKRALALGIPSAIDVRSHLLPAAVTLLPVIVIE
jgi:hypothetical protein